MSVKYPEIEVELCCSNGNAIIIVGVVKKAMRRAGVEKAEQDAFSKEALSGDYDHVLQTCMSWVNVT